MILQKKAEKNCYRVVMCRVLTFPSATLPCLLRRNNKCLYVVYVVFRQPIKRKYISPSSFLSFTSSSFHRKYRSSK
jgi:hypothetical protein